MTPSIDLKTATPKELLSEIRALRRAFNKDIRDASVNIPDREIRYLVDMYYTAQEMRIGVEGKLRSIGEKPNAILVIFLDMFGEVEKDIQAALDVYTANNPIGASFRRIRGIGPVLTAAWLSHVNVHIADTPSKVMSFGGYNPNMVWGKGEKRPYNADLKLVFSKMGRAFVFLANRGSYFGQKYKENKALIQKRSDRGAFKERCEHFLATRNYKKETQAYQAYIKGQYPPAHITASARLKTVSLCISILHREHYRLIHGKLPADPFLIAFPDATPNVYGDKPFLPAHHRLIDIQTVVDWEATAPKSMKAMDKPVADEENLSDSVQVAYGDIESEDEQE